MLCGHVGIAVGTHSSVPQASCCRRGVAVRCYMGVALCGGAAAVAASRRELGWWVLCGVVHCGAVLCNEAVCPSVSSGLVIFNSGVVLGSGFLLALPGPDLGILHMLFVVNLVGA